MIDDIDYQLSSSIYVAIGGHCYATLIKTDIQLIAFDRLVLLGDPVNHSHANDFQ